MNDASSAHPLGEDRIERSIGGLVVVRNLDCQSWGMLGVHIATSVRDHLTDPIWEAVNKLTQSWPTIWEVARPALEAELETYGNTDAIKNNEVLLKIWVHVPMTFEHPLTISLKFEPFAGFYDVTILGDEVIDCGAAF